jgi:hypothetical protein
MASLTPSLPEKAFEATETDTFASLASSLSVTVIPPFLTFYFIIPPLWGAVNKTEKNFCAKPIDFPPFILYNGDIAQLCYTD